MPTRKCVCSERGRDCFLLGSMSSDAFESMLHNVLRGTLSPPSMRCPSLCLAWKALEDNVKFGPRAFACPVVQELITHGVSSGSKSQRGREESVSRPRHCGVGKRGM